MFNVTVLKMRDIFKVIIEITFLVVVVLGISKIFHKDTKENSKGIQKIENGIKAVSQFSMINCMDQTIPTMSSINEEYKNTFRLVLKYFQRLLQHNHPSLIYCCFLSINVCPSGCKLIIQSSQKYHEVHR